MSKPFTDYLRNLKIVKRAKLSKRRKARGVQYVSGSGRHSSGDKS